MAAKTTTRSKDPAIAIRDDRGMNAAVFRALRKAAAETRAMQSVSTPKPRSRRRTKAG